MLSLLLLFYNLSMLSLYIENYVKCSHLLTKLQTLFSHILSVKIIFLYIKGLTYSPNVTINVDIIKLLSQTCLIFRSVN